MQDTDELEARIKKHVSREGYRPVKPVVIAKKLNVPKDEIRLFKRALKRLIKRKEVTWGSKHLVINNDSPETKRPQVLGRFKMTNAGFGVVRTLADTPNYGQTDVHIPGKNCLDAARGDLVRIKILKKRDRDIEYGGRVEEVVQRRTHRFVGTYFEEMNWGYVQIDGNDFNEPISVGDAGAKDAKPGDKVVLEMVHFPSFHSPGEAVLIEVLGPHGRPGVDTMLVMNQYGLVAEFPDRVLEDAREQAEKFDETVSGDRVDLTEENIITIDPKDARDFDDAISLKRTENGHWLLGVHIADVSHFVRPNTALDDEAYQRGTSVYLPDRVVPMLPEIISNNLASLQPDRVRYAMTAFIEFTEDGARVATDVKRTAIKSKRRFTYEEVDDFLDRPVAWRRKLTPDLFSLLERMHKLAMTLRERRIRDGAIELHLPEVKIDLDGKGGVAGAHTTVHTVSHQIIEEFMLAANEAVAELFVDREIPFLRRIHPQPDMTKLDQLTEFVRGLGIKTDSLASRFEIQRLVAKVKQLPQSQAVNFGILRSMSKARYSPEDDGHYALGSDAYCHFTSPIRRYPDLVIHRMVGALADGNKPGVDALTLARIGDDCSISEENAERAERDLIKLKLLGFFSNKIGKKLKAVITGVTRRGFYAQGTELPVEGLVSVHALPDDRYQFDQNGHALIGYRSGNQFRLGDSVEVQVTKVDMDRRELDFTLESHEARQTVRIESDSSRGGDRRDRPPRGKHKREANSRSGENSRGREQSKSEKPKTGKRKPSKGKPGGGKRKPAKGKRPKR